MWKPTSAWAICVMLSLSGSACGQPNNNPQPARENVAMVTDVVYGAAGERELKLDIYQPKEPSAESLPIIVWIHGGGWRAGNKSSGHGRLGPFVASGNYLGFSVGYRLSGEAIWPAQIHDCKAAIRWIRANAKKYGGDADRIGVWGSSAGGHLASLLGTSGDVEELEGPNGTPDVSSRVTCVVDYCGPADFHSFYKQTERVRGPNSPETRLFGGTIEEKSETATQASPVTHVSKDDPPFLIVHGTNDSLIPIAQAEQFHQRLEHSNVNSTFIKMINGGHGIGGREITERVKAFFDRHLRNVEVDISDEPITVQPRSRR